MRVLIIDDSSSKLAEITSVVRDTSESFHIDCCLDCVINEKKI